MDGDLQRLTRALRELRAQLYDLEQRSALALEAVPDGQRESARNLVHYLALRKQDLRALQDQLAEVGLSSLGRAEAAVAATLDAVLAMIAATTHDDHDPMPRRSSVAEGRARLERNTTLLWGQARVTRGVRILVTLPSEAADDPQLVRDLLAGGADAVRINCAHDDAAAWLKMIGHVRAAAPSCRVLMDLAGPKLRTGALAAGPEVIKLRPKRGPLGNVLQPATIWLRPNEESGPADSRSLPLPRHFLDELAVGDQLELQDARGGRRTLEVTRSDGAARQVRCWKSCYVVTGARISHDGNRVEVGRLAPLESSIVVKPGDRLVLTRDPRPGADFRIPCTLPEVLPMAQPGESVWIDDGKIGGRVVSADENELTLAITHADRDGARVRADKSINLPDTRIELPPLTAKDCADLELVAAHADAVGLSFVRSAADVTALHDRLAALGRPDLGIVLKIETKQAFADLPSLLLEAMRGGPVGVMIARGDLAVECGWERLAEVQEEILWICEAAHVPVVWATQVLEELAKEGLPTRAEITDAAMGERAECVMLNKGPHLREAVATLDGILRRMQAHQSKKRSMLRPLALATRFAAVEHAALIS
jgi:pyruvate kinase